MDCREVRFIVYLRKAWREGRRILILKNLRISAKGGTYPLGMRNRSNFAKGNMFSARQGSQPLGSRDFRARAAALNGDLAEIARFIYTRPAGDSLGGSFFF